jgi:putative DNA methylase
VVKVRKKLIEVALPLEAINAASAREKSIRHGHPSTLHLWWARRPLASARAVIFAQMVDDPSSCPDLFPTEKAQQKERKRLFKIIEDLVQWENTTNEKVLNAAREEIWQSWRRACADNADHPQASELFDRNKLPAFHDPFAGGGALPLEAQRLGLESYASDLNPVAVLINKAMIEIPPKFAGMPPVNPEARNDKSMFARKWKGAEGLAEDVRYYGKWMRDEAEKRIGHLYPKVEITAEMAEERSDLKQYVGQKLTVIAWLWARTVTCPNPGCACEMPLISSLTLSSRKGKEWYLRPIVRDKSIDFQVVDHLPAGELHAKAGYKRGLSGIFECAFCGTITTRDYVAQQATEKGLGVVQTALVLDGGRGRIYLPPLAELQPLIAPNYDVDGMAIDLAPNPRDVWCRNFGLRRPVDLFTFRQFAALTAFSELVTEACNKVVRDAVDLGIQNDQVALRDGGVSAKGYSEAVATYLSFAVDKCSDYWSSLCSWHNSRELIRNTFGRQAIPMVWDFAEANPMGDSSGNWMAMVDWTWKALRIAPATVSGVATQADAASQNLSLEKVISTDPPYYDNIGYADLSDFFYAWLRRNLREIYPGLFSTLSVPKAEELVALPYRHRNKQEAEMFFLNGMSAAMRRLSEQAHPAFPVTIYYAFKQSESSERGVTNTGWDTFLAAVIEAGFEVTGTWPMRTELGNRMVSSGTNALASSIVLVCNKRTESAATAARREFVATLRAELPRALLALQAGNIAPVDLAQAAIGPGMAVFTRFAKVIDAEGAPISVREALALINQTLDEALAEQEGDFDVDSRWALAWFEQCGFEEGEYGVAEVLANAKNTAVKGLQEAGILVQGRGKVRLLKPQELPSDWDPATDTRLTSWEVVHHLIRELESAGESGAAKLMAVLGSKAEAARELCYRLYSLCERKKRANEALAYNGLVQSWPEISRLSREQDQIVETTQASLF